MKLLEIFDKAVPFEVVVNTDDSWAAEFTSNKRLITFDAEKFDHNVWHVQFVENLNQVKLTGSGKQFEVLRTIKDIMMAFVEEKDPKGIEFLSSGRGRSKAYAHMLQRFVPPGYSFEKHSDDSLVDDMFMIIKDDKKK